MRAEQIRVAPSHDQCRELQELRTQVATLTAKTEALQTAMQHLPVPGVQPLPRHHRICYWCRSPATYNESVEPNGCTNSNSEATSTLASKTVQRLAEDHVFHPSRETSGPRCRKPGNGEKGCCRTDEAVPHSGRACERQGDEGFIRHRERGYDND